VAAALIELWTLFDYPCGQRLVPLLREQVPRLRQQGWWQCPEEVAAKLVRISAKTADRLLAPQRRRLRLDRRRGRSMRRLLLEQIPLKVAEEWDRRQVGNLQVDFVAHCGQSTAGRFLWTVSTVDVTANGWDREPVVHLAAKTRRGSKVHRRYDVPATPYQRLLASGQLSQAARESLQQRYASLNPIQLRQQIEQRQNELLRTLRRSETGPDSVRKLTPPFGYFFRDPTGGRSVTGGNDLTRPLPRPRIMLKSPGWVVIHSVRQGSLRASDEPAGFGCRPGAAKAPRRKRHDVFGQPIASC
jgi:hypothetical protein